MNQNGVILILSSPSAGGKTTLRNMMLSRYSNLRASISVTTRKPRPGEVNGSDYYFCSDQEYQAMLESNLLMEAISIYGNNYGTHSDFVQKQLNDGFDLIFTIDFHGMNKIKQRFKNTHQVVTIFIIPPSMDELGQRMLKRDGNFNLETRLEAANAEIGNAEQYDYVILNNDLQLAFKDISSIFDAEKIKNDKNNILKTYSKLR